MSEIRERAKEWIDRWDMSMAKAKDLGLGLWPDDIRECYTIITDLLAELEAENERLKKQVVQWERFYPNHATAKNEGRQQAARECVDFVAGMAVFPYRQIVLGVSSAIKKHFKLED